jgi:hypothetical protein
LEDIDGKAWMKRREGVQEFLKNTQQGFLDKLAKVQAFIKESDPNKILEQIYTHAPIIPKLEYDIADKPSRGNGLNVTNKLGGIPDLRRHWRMNYRDKKGKKKISVEEMVKGIWPKSPDGEYLSCMATVDLGTNIYLLSHVFHEPSTFAYHKHISSSLNGHFAIFSTYCPGFDNRLDACVIKLDDHDHGISEEEYIQALNRFKPTSHYKLKSPTFGFDLDLEYDDTRVSEVQRSALWELRDVLLDDRLDDVNHPFHSNYGAATFGGEPTSQQEPRRYMDINSYPYPCRMTPFFGFSSPYADMNYQIYTPRWPSEEAQMTYYGKIDASCT